MATRRRRLWWTPSGSKIFPDRLSVKPAKTLSERFRQGSPEIVQSISINRQDVSHSINTQMDSLIPASKISTLTQECSSERWATTSTSVSTRRYSMPRLWWTQKSGSEGRKAYKPIPILTDIPTKEAMEIAIQDNYDQVKQDVREIVLRERYVWHRKLTATDPYHIRSCTANPYGCGFFNTLLPRYLRWSSLLGVFEQLPKCLATTGHVIILRMLLFNLFRAL